MNGNNKQKLENFLEIGKRKICSFLAKKMENSATNISCGFHKFSVNSIEYQGELPAI